MKVLQTLQAIAVNLARRGAALVAKFARSLLKRRLGIAKTVATVLPGELAVDEDGDTGFSRAGAGVIRREDARSRGGDDKGLSFREEAQRDADGFVLRAEERGFAVQRINEDAAESRSGKRKKMAAAHVRECNRGKWQRHLGEEANAFVL